MSEDNSQTHRAELLGAAKEPELSEHTRALKALREEKERKDAELNVAVVDGELARINKLVNPQMAKIKSVEERLKEEVQSEVELDIAERNVRKFIDENYADDQELQDRLRKALDKKVKEGLV